MARYFTNVGPEKGPFLDRDARNAIGVLESPTNHMPIGMALGVGPPSTGPATWRLKVRSVELPGLWVVVDREFVPAG